MATQKEVADRAGVAPITVSRVVSGLGGVKDGTRARVEAAIRELHYYPNRQAQALASGLLRTVALVTPHMSEVLLSGHYYLLQLLSGVVAMGRLRHLDVLLSTDFDQEGEFDFLRVWHQRKVDGLIFVGLAKFSEELLAEVHQQQIPCVSISERTPTFSWIDTDNHRAAQDAVQLLLDRGHRHFAFIGAIQRGDFHPNFTDREEGVRNALDRARSEGMAVSLAILPGLNADLRSDVQTVQAFLALSPRPTAIISANDAHALVFLREAKRCGLRYPRDFSIIGFDAEPEGRLIRPTLASFSQPFVDMGKIAVDTLLLGMAAETPTKKTMVFPLKFVPGGSLGPAPTSE